jgi:glutamate synthase (NADPH/NADH) small chain
MEKHHIDRRIEQMELEGVTFHFNQNIGTDSDINEIIQKYDAVILTGGSEKPRDLPIQGRDLDGIHFAMDFLPMQNRVNSLEINDDEKTISANGKHVVVIGGGDTGSDCIGTSFRQGALSVTQLEIMPEPPEKENKALTWPNWPLKMRTSSSQAEGALRDFSVMTESFTGVGGKLTALNCIRVDNSMKKIPNSDFGIKADLVLLAMGFVHPLHEGLVKNSGVELNDRGNVSANDFDYQTNKEKVFVAGDMRRGQSLVVWAIREGRQAAHSVDKFLMGSTKLPR